MRIALGVQYNGTHYAGWQTQAHTLGIDTLQEALEAALSSIANQAVSVVCAGRTDAGVHALQQVVHFDTDITRPIQAWIRGVNAKLPRDMSIRWAHIVDNDFHARFSAIARRYTYVLIADAVRPALSYQQAGWTHLHLDVKAMQQAAHILLGEHDFSTFRASQCQAKNPIRHLQALEIVQNGKVYFMHFKANAFLHHMVRNIVGGLVYVGSGRWDLNEFKRTFEAKDRTQGAPTFWSDGLYFCGPEYPKQYLLPEPVQVSPLISWPWAF